MAIEGSRAHARILPTTILRHLLIWKIWVFNPLRYKENYNNWNMYLTPHGMNLAQVNQALKEISLEKFGPINLLENGLAPSLCVITVPREKLKPPIIQRSPNQIDLPLATRFCNLLNSTYWIRP